jgi:hypothetical protein
MAGNWALLFLNTSAGISIIYQVSPLPFSDRCNATGIKKADL